MSIRPNPAGQNKKIKWGHLQNFKTYVNNASKEEEQLTPEEKRQQLFAAMKPYNSEDYIGKAIFVVGGGGVYDTTPSVSPTPTPTPSITPTRTLTPTPSITPTNTITPSITPTNTTTPTITPTKTGTPTPTPSSSPIPSGTTEANAYLTRVVSAGGTLNSTISAATRTLFTSLVSNNLYDKLFVFYPHLGGVSASHRLNAKSTGFTLTVNGGWIFDINGSKPNGTNAFLQAQDLAPYVFGTQNSSAVGALLNTTTSKSTGISDMGCLNYIGNTTRYYFAPYFDATPGNNPRVALNSSPTGANTLGNVEGTYVMSRTGSTQFEFYQQGVLTNTFTSTSDVPGQVEMYICAENEQGITKFYSDRRQGFTFMGSGLSGAEAATLTTIINTWASAIGRAT